MKQSVSRHETKSFKRLKLFETLNEPDSDRLLLSGYRAGLVDYQARSTTPVIYLLKFVRFVRLFVRPSVRGARLSSIHLSSAYP